MFLEVEVDMAHRANINFYLYTGFGADSAQAFDAYQHLKSLGLEFTHLHYNSPDQYGAVLEWANNTFSGTPYEAVVTGFPFIVYEKAFDVRDTPPREPVLVYGLDAIKATDWKALESFAG